MLKSLYIALGVTLFSPGAFAQDSWTITAENINPQDYYGVTVANGQVGVLSSPQPLKTDKMILAGVYDIYGRGRVSNFVPGIKMLDINLRINGTHATADNVSDYRQTLDMRHGRMLGEFRVGNLADVSYSYTALRHLPFNTMLEVTVMPLKDVSMRVDNIISADQSLRDVNEYYTAIRNKPDTYCVAATTAKTPVKGIVTGGASVILPDPSRPAPDFEHFSNTGYGSHSVYFSVKLEKGKPYTFHVIGSSLSEVTHSDVRNSLERLSAFVAVEGPGRLMARHNAEWDRLWESDILVDGDPQGQQDIHAMIYHLYSFLREGSRMSLSPMGLSGFGYNGHVFWDAETWVFPAALLLHPELAKSMLDYRFDRLDAARRNAYQHGYRGAQFPWESSDTGEEEIPSHVHFGNLENHISADVALAAWQYYCVTRDVRWLRSTGWPLISETADFWLSRVDGRPDGAGYDIKNVVGADEWNVNSRGGKNVDNNAYTIGAAKTNLDIASKAAAVLGIEPDPMWEKVSNGLAFEYLPNGCVREHSTYSGEKTKQADVVLLAYPLSFLTAPADVSRNLEYYLTTVPRKDTPAMSKSVYSILYSQLGDIENAWKFYQESYVPNLNPPFRVMAEFDGGTNPYFITGAGGTLQSILFGFGGLRITDDGLVHTSTRLPARWRSLSLRLPTSR